MKGMGHDALIQKMVGREIGTVYRDKPTGLPEELMRVQQLCLSKATGEKVLQDIHFTLHKGEVLGIFGLMGAGRTELLEAIFGLHPGLRTGVLAINGRTVSVPSPAAAIKAGLALVPEDRKKDGVVLGLDVRKNIGLTTLPQLQTLGLLDEAKQSALAEKYIGDLQIKTSSHRQLVRNLSGGNQQKIVLAKWLATHPAVLMLDEPTRGIDIHAKTEIYRLILGLAGDGMGIIVVSSEMPELLAVADRILVLCEGRLTAALNRAEATEDNILKAAIPKIN
jgi:ribose transport system ATP-binding protein